jgi:predicted RNA-binding protein with PIN domain
MHYLIDGYNLLHAMGVIRGRLGPLGLEKARGRLLGLLRGAHGDESASVTVVFDAAGAPPGAAEERSFQGIRVQFARRPHEADDVIEMLIGLESVPRQLTVVSDDHRVQRAARRRHCPVQGCLDYLDELDRKRFVRQHQPQETPEKGTHVSGTEVRRWMDEFADLEKDPNWRELADPYGFGEILDQ